MSVNGHEIISNEATVATTSPMVAADDHLLDSDESKQAHSLPVTANIMPDSFSTSCDTRTDMLHMSPNMTEESSNTSTDIKSTTLCPSRKRRKSQEEYSSDENSEQKENNCGAVVSVGDLPIIKKGRFNGDLSITTNPPVPSMHNGNLIMTPTLVNDSKSKSDEVIDLSTVGAKLKNNEAVDMSKSSAIIKTNDRSVSTTAESNEGIIDLSISISKKSTTPIPAAVLGDADVIMLSDEDDETERVTKEGNVNGITTPELLNEKLLLIKQLGEQLRNEETKMLLLQKLRHSQANAAQHATDNLHRVPHSGTVGQHQLNHRASGSQPSHQPQQHQHGMHNSNRHMPPILSSGYGRLNQQQQAEILRQQQMMCAGSNQKAPPLSVTNNLMNSRPVPTSVVRCATDGSQNRVYQVGTTGPLQQHQQPLQQSKQVMAAPPAPSPQSEQITAQRQAAAKMALRKQLEKTLLQIPPPKPPPPELNFITTYMSGDFIPLIGLEEVVKYIQEAASRSVKRSETNGAATNAAPAAAEPEVKYIFNPFVCIQCGTDFTPVWKRDKPGSKNVICERCVTGNQKKVLKQEHTSRLKSAFVKALQQEQEIEKVMKVQATSAPQVVSSQPNSASFLAQQQSQQRFAYGSSRSSVVVGAQPPAAHSASKLANYYPSAVASISQQNQNSSRSIQSAGRTNQNMFYKGVTPEQLRQQQSLLQLQQAAQLRSLRPSTGVAQNFAAAAGLQSFANSNRQSLQYATLAAAAVAKQPLNIQRQYLLDMIPRSMPGNNGRTSSSGQQWKK